MPDNQDYLSLIDAARELKVSRQWLRKLVNAGKAPEHIFVAGRTIFLRSSVEEHARRAIQT